MAGIKRYYQKQDKTKQNKTKTKQQKQKQDYFQKPE